MKNIVYLSKSNYDFNLDELQELAQLAAKKNKSLNITGYLCYSKKRFIQYLEGNPEDIDSLLNTIRNDQRHDFIYELENTPITDRLFSSWSMRYITEPELSKFNLEHCIEQNLVFIKHNFNHKERCIDFVWKHVNSIAIMLNSLSRKPGWTSFP